MKIMTGTKREITIQLWEEQIEKHMKRLNESMECFRRFHETDDLTHMLEDIENLTENITHCREAIEHMDAYGVI